MFTTCDTYKVLQNYDNVVCCIFSAGAIVTLLGSSMFHGALSNKDDTSFAARLDNSFSHIAQYTNETVEVFQIHTVSTKSCMSQFTCKFFQFLMQCNVVHAISEIICNRSLK